MGLANIIRRSIASVIAAGTLALNSNAEPIAGTELLWGYGSTTYNRPNGVEQVTITGDTGLIDVEQVTSGTVNVPSTYGFGGQEIGVGIYVGNRSENSLLNFRVGVELNYYNLVGLFEEQDRLLDPNSRLIAHEGSSDSPTRGVYGKFGQRNKFFVEKDLFSKDVEGMQHTFIALFKIDEYTEDLYSFTARAPYGDEWYGSTDQIMTSEQKINSRKFDVPKLGLRWWVGLAEDEYDHEDSLLGKMRGRMFLDYLTSIGSDQVEKSWLARLGMSVDW